MPKLAICPTSGKAALGAGSPDATLNPMTRTILYAIVGTLTMSASAWAHNGAHLTAQAASGITADGDLSDWPDIAGVAVPYAEYGAPLQGEGDLRARLRVAWDRPHTALYISLAVQDDDVVIVSATTGWNRQDGCEIYIDSEHGTEASGARQHVIRGPWDASSESASMQAGWSRTDGGYSCEWRVDLSEIDE